MPAEPAPNIQLSAEQFIDQLAQSLVQNTELDQEVVAVIKAALIRPQLAETAPDATARALEALAVERARAGRTA